MDGSVMWVCYVSVRKKKRNGCGNSSIIASKSVRCTRNIKSIRDGWAILSKCESKTYMDFTVLIVKAKAM